MTFELRKPPLDADGEILPDLFPDWLNALMDKFAASPEAQALGEVELGWTTTVVHALIVYEGLPLHEAEPEHVLTVVMGWIPRKVACSPKEAPAIIAELQAFFTFAERAWGLEQGGDCAAALEGTEHALTELLADPESWGMAKTFVMQGEGSGFDMSSPEGLAAFALASDPAHGSRGSQRAEQRRAARKLRSAKRRARRRKG